ncbi:MAG: tRNA pseudouridine(13) synthase TruD [Pseudomonadales bacterium]
MTRTSSSSLSDASGEKPVVAASRERAKAPASRWERALHNSWSHAQGAPSLAGKLRVEPEDFCVRELLRFEPEAADPAGASASPHRLLKLEKRVIDTLALQRQLAERCGCKLRDIGYAGLKDKHALCEQWMSIPALGDGASLQRLREWQVSGAGSWRIIDVRPQRRKLAQGAHRGNQFAVRVRNVFLDNAGSQQNVDRGNSEAALQARAEAITARGFPNYFGEQRFGLNAGNLARGFGHFVQGRRASRAQHGLYLSALRSYLFNEVLHRRVVDQSWCKVLPGDALVLDGSKSFFRPDANATEQEKADIADRITAGDLHVGGPLFGKKADNAQASSAVEEAVLVENSDIAECLARAGAQYAVRALRVIPRDLVLLREQSDVVLTFTLPAGSFATALLRELFAYRDVSREAQKNTAQAMPDETASEEPAL